MWLCFVLLTRRIGSKEIGVEEVGMKSVSDMHVRDCSAQFQKFVEEYVAHWYCGLVFR